MKNTLATETQPVMVESPYLLKKFFGTLISFILLLPLPWMSLVIGTTILWDRIWQKFRTTTLAEKIGRSLDNVVAKIAKPLLIDQRNASYLYSLIGIGIYTPTLFIGTLIWHINYANQANWPTLLGIAFAYHVLMMGPYFRFFAYISTLAHKEGHAPQGLFKPAYAFLNYAFGWFLGLIYGHVPETYPLGHLRIHHKHDNGPEDITSTRYLDRTQPLDWLIYLRKFALYWSGISVLIYFIKRKSWKYSRRMAIGMLTYCGTAALFIMIQPWFGFAYLILPMLQIIIALAAINYTWHTFLDPDDPDNEYISSMTILEGHYNVFNEDYHVVHHQRPQSHWSEAPEDFYKHLEAYRKHKATIFRDTHVFELFTWIIAKRYDLLAAHFVDLSNEMNQEQIEELLISRMKPIRND